MTNPQESKVNVLRCKWLRRSLYLMQSAAHVSDESGSLKESQAFGVNGFLSIKLASLTNAQSEAPKGVAAMRS
jgi:hypothetical protein